MSEKYEVVLAGGGHNALSVAAYLAKGEKLETAVKQAKTYLTKAIHRGSEYVLGQGHGPVHHFHEFW